jgi:hypothetical protein
VREAKGEQSAQLIDHLKKGDMVKVAERLLDGTGWLPEPLRLIDSETATDAETAAVEALPAFLADGDDDATAADADEPEPRRVPSPPNEAGLRGGFGRPASSPIVHPSESPAIAPGGSYDARVPPDASGEAAPA